MRSSRTTLTRTAVLVRCFLAIKEEEEEENVTLGETRRELTDVSCPTCVSFLHRKRRIQNGGRRSYRLKFKKHLMSSYITVCGAAAEKAVS